MKVVITGGHGFLGWHTACRLRAHHGIEAVSLDRGDFNDDGTLLRAVNDADAVFHIAGVNRAASDEAVREGNLALAQRLATAVRSAARPVRIVYANSIQAKLDNAYGRGKAESAETLREAAASTGGSVADVLLPNLFGEHGRPRYNSFVATFSYAVASGEAPTVTDDKEVPLLHAQNAAAALISAVSGSRDELLEPAAEKRWVSEVLSMLRSFHSSYERGEIPPLVDDFSIDLFNTYRSYTFPGQFPRYATVHADPRGDLFETVRSHGGTGQSFVSTTRPGKTRGDHYHLRKVERFYVVKGTAEIALRRLLHEDTVRFTVRGDRPGFVDMPTMWVHNITNVGSDDLVTVFWADQLLDPDNPDQFPESVTLEATA